MPGTAMPGMISTQIHRKLRPVLITWMMKATWMSSEMIRIDMLLGLRES